MEEYILGEYGILSTFVLCWCAVGRRCARVGITNGRIDEQL